MNTMFQRSTKGASKQRRDWINTEINEIKEYLPVSESVRRRLSQLQVMALCKAYIAKTNCFRNAVSDHDDNECWSNFDFPEALPGFLLAITLEGKLLHISENVTEYLGHSVVDLMTQADTVYDIIDTVDHAVLREFLMAGKTKGDATRPSSQDELSFACRMSLGRLFRRNNAFDLQKIMKMMGRLIWPEGRMSLSEPIFVACCSPMLTCSTAEQATALETMIFQSSHSLDMKFNDVDSKGEFHLGQSKEELYQKSWYQLIHPDDIALASYKHMEMIRGGVETAQSLCIRLQTMLGHFTWVHVVMRLSGAPFVPLGSPADSIPQEVLCLNHVISEAEALETRHRESWEEMMSMNGARSGSNRFDPPQLREELSYLPTIVVTDGFLDEVTSEPFAQPAQTSDCNRQELMRKLRCKAQQKRAKKAKIDEGICTSFDSFESSSCHNTGNIQQYVRDSNLSFASQMTQFSGASPRCDSLAPPDCYVQQGPMTPAYSDDGYGTDCTITHYTAPTPEFAAASCTPPYSPPSNFSYLDEAPSHSSLDDSSFFDVAAVKSSVVPAKILPAVQVLQPKFIDDLPELDQCLVASFLDGVECKETPMLSSYSSLASSGQRWVPSNAEAFQACPAPSFGLINDTPFSSIHDGRYGVHDSTLSSDVSFMDMITGPLFYETVDILSAEQLQF